MKPLSSANRFDGVYKWIAGARLAGECSVLVTLGTLGVAVYQVSPRLTLYSSLYGPVKGGKA